MAEAFIGLSVLATLKEPPNAKVRGLVIDVANQQLTLNKVRWLASGLPEEILVVHGSNILEIEVEAETPKSNTRSNEGKPGLLDPAIVSYERRVAPSVRRPMDPQLNGTYSEPQPNPPSQAAVTHPPHTQHLVPSQAVKAATLEKGGHVYETGLTKSHESITPSATLSGPFNDLSLNGQVHEVGLDDQIFERSSQQPVKFLREPGARLEQAAKVGRRRARKSTARTTASSQTQPLLEVVPTTIPPSNQKRRNKAPKGWRQTPLLSEPAVTEERQPHSQHATVSLNSSLKPGSARHTKHTLDQAKGRHQRYREEEDQNGWATGEVTDIQEMGDFDFEENLSKFDKRKVFDQIRQDDTTADESRLVSFNRLPTSKAGTAGGKNLHHTENVLDSALQKVVEHSSDSELEISETMMSRTSTRRGPSRIGSALVADSHHGSSSAFVADSVGMARTRSAHSRAASPKSKKDSSTILLKMSGNRSCPSVSPLQMLELEQLATSEVGLTEEMMTENAARSIAETAHKLSNVDNKEHPDRWSTPLIVILAGNHKTGSRAIAAARHLRNHGARVILCILGLEREDDLLDSVQRQLKIFRNCGGQAIKQDGLLRTLRRLQAPTDLIVDALLGVHIAFDDLRTDDQASYFQLMFWANSGDAATLSLDIPSGIDASTGILTSHDSQPLHLHAAHVLAIGAVKTGLVTALERVEGTENLGLYVADIGISPSTWKKFGTRRRRGVEFGGQWVVPMQYESRELNAKTVDDDGRRPRWL